MGLPNNELQILAAIENQLQEDPSLASKFSAFTSVTRSGHMPAAEQLGTPNSLAGWRRSRRTGGVPKFLGRTIVALAAMVAVLVMALEVALVAVLGVGQNRCEPAYTAVRGGAAAACIPLGSGGRLQAPHFRPRKGDA